jgi:hypothetical protein
MYFFDLIQIQVALLEISNMNQQDRLFYTINEKLGSVFTEPPTITPIPNALPGLKDQNGIAFEIPIVQAKGKAHNISMNISQTRIDFFINFNKNQIISEIEFFSEKITALLGCIQQPKRIGVVAQYLHQTKDTQKTIKKIIKKDDESYSDVTFSMSKEFKKTSAIGKRYFQIHEIDTLVIDKKSKAVFVTIDTNYLSHEKDFTQRAKTIVEIINEYKTISVEEVFV